MTVDYQQYVNLNYGRKHNNVTNNNTFNMLLSSFVQELEHLGLDVAVESCSAAEVGESAVDVDVDGGVDQELAVEGPRW